MTAPVYDRWGVQVFAGDCLDVLRAMPDASIDAVVTDPPYGLAEHKPTTIATALTAWTSGDREHVPDGKGFMGRAWDGFVPPPAVWDECLRVLKPGGHLLCFAGTRTFDLMTISVRLAGFEIRDSIGHASLMAWVQGAGFPKSLDVSKAIDKARDDRADILRITGWLAEQRDRTGWTNRRIDEAFGFSGMAGHWTAAPHLKIAQVPQWDQWCKLRELLGFGDDMDAEVRRLNGRKGTPGNERTDRVVSLPGANAVYQPTQRVEHAGTPVLDAARQWSGWGTALKPAVEPVIVAVKPQDATGTLAEIGSHLARLEAECSSLARRTAATSSSAPTPHDEPAARTASAPASAATPPGDEQAQPTATGAEDGSSATTATSWSASAVSTCSNTVTSWKACWDELCALTSTSTTSTTTEPTTDLRTLLSCLSRLTAESMAASLSPHGGPSSLASAADSLFGAVLLNSRATLALSATEPATGSMPTSHQGGAAPGGSRPAWEPIIVARKPLSGTVAANVLAHGTGALNIDACRVAHGDDLSRYERSATSGFKQGGVYGDGDPVLAPASPAGRWPTNVVLSHAPGCGDGCVDGCPVAELDAQSGVTTSGSRKAGEYGLMGYMGADAAPMPAVAGDSGGASRFFPVFRWEPKTPTSERPQVNGVSHPTVKPVNLMRWLVRLVTPPGGLVLDPFAGTGTTGQAARAEGMRAVLVERDPDHLPLIRARLDARPRTAASEAPRPPDEPMDLLDLLGGEAS